MSEREMHKVVCAECGEECEVPFKPDGRNQCTAEIAILNADRREEDIELAN